MSSEQAAQRCAVCFPSATEEQDLLVRVLQRGEHLEIEGELTDDRMLHEFLPAPSDRPVLIERTPERDLIAMATELGLGVTLYSPLAGGVLTGKYSRADLTRSADEPADGTRRAFNQAMGGVTERNLAIVDVVQQIAGELGHTPAQVALAWTLHRPGVTAPSWAPAP